MRLKNIDAEFTISQTEKSSIAVARLYAVILMEILMHYVVKNCEVVWIAITITL